MEARKAIGLIETRGFGPMIMALDAMTKAANVVFDGHVVFDGLVTAKIRGDLSAVKHAVEMGDQAARQVGEVVSVKVIATVATSMAEMLAPGAGRVALGTKAGVKAIGGGEKKPQKKE